MAADDESKGSHPFHYEDGVPVFDVGRVDKLERAASEAEARDNKYKEEQLKLDREQISINKWMMRFTAALVFCTIVSGGITGYQAHVAKISAQSASDNAAAAKAQAEAAKQQVIEMRSSGTDTHTLAKAASEQAITSKKQSISTGALAENAQDTLEQTRSAFRDEQRAWIGIAQNRVAQFETNKPIKVEINITNAGKTPALHLREWGKYRFSNLSELGPEMTDLVTVDSRSFGTVPPQGAQTIYIEVPWEKWKSSELSVAIRSTYPSFFGEFSYDDVSGRSHKTQYCLFMNDLDLHTLRFCDSWNDMN